MKNLSVTSLDPDAIKASLIDFIQSQEGFEDIDYEGSAINTIVDLLTYNSTMISYQANMLANESFLDSAKIRKNVSSHAQKLSYVPKSRTASRMICNISVIPPASATNIPNSIVMEPNTQFIGSVGGESFTFTNTKSYVLSFRASTGKYTASGVSLYQGQLLTETTYHTPKQKVVIENKNVDTDTLIVDVDGIEFNKTSSIDELSNQSPIYFLSESYSETYAIEFGKNILGIEPNNNTKIDVWYIATEDNHANGVSSLISGSSISGFPNVVVDVTTKSYGGSDKQDIEEIRFIAPKIYQAQDRALTDSDYVPLIKQQFPFVRSVITWGGENNVPPEYGTVFVSIISDIGLVTTAVKNDIISYLSSRNVGSITPKIIDPVEFYGDLYIQFAYDDRLTSKTFSGLQTDIQNVIDIYNVEIGDFDRYYNKSELISRIMDIEGVTTVSINLSVGYNNKVSNFPNTVYKIDFGNAITKGTILAHGFDVVVNATNTKLYDDDGDIRLSYNTDTQIVDKSVGSVDYETGVVEFVVNITDGTDDFNIVCMVKDDNFFVKQNRVFRINSSNIELLPNQRYRR